MSLADKVVCVKCGRENPAESQFCGYCGHRLDRLSERSMVREDIGLICPKCGKESSLGSRFCGYCGNIYGDPQVVALQVSLDMQRRQLEEMKKVVKQQAEQTDTVAKCPHCGSSSLVANKKGYGIGKGVIGAAMFGPLGLIAGNIGSDEVRMTCLNCGRQYQRSFGRWRRV